MGTIQKKNPNPDTRSVQGSKKTAPSKKLTAAKRYRRWKRRMLRRYPWLKNFHKFLQILLLIIAAAVILMVLLRVRDNKLDTQSVPEPTAIASAAPVYSPVPESSPITISEASATPQPTAVPTAVPTAEPTPEAVKIGNIPEEYFYQTAQAGAAYSDNNQNRLITQQMVYVEGNPTANYQRETPIHMAPSAEYAELEGVTTFRGSNYRDGGAYGTIPENPSQLSVVWSQRIGKIDEWGGVGWTGQASAVRWPAEMRAKMNITDAKKNKDGLVECIYATLDGRIYFFDMEDGAGTRSPINIGAPIKGSVTVDPRGYPLLYCGQGIYRVGGERVKCGTRVWSLFDQSLIWAINGNDKLALRDWEAFDCAPLVDAKTDTLIQTGENGVLYTLKLNTQLNENSIAVAPQTVRYVYDHSLRNQIGTENSIVCYNNYVYFANNSGVIQCVDLNTQKLVWSVNAKDDIDASMALEVEEDGLVALYAANELDLRGHHGSSQLFKINALTGELIWYIDSDEIYQNNENGGGSFATPAIGKQGLSELIYFHVARTKEDGGTLYAVNKETGAVVWKHAMGKYGWSSPTCVYTQSGKGYVLVGSSSGIMRLFDGLTGAVVASTDLGSNIEGSPVVFDDMVVIGTRGARVYGLKIS